MTTIDAQCLIFHLVESDGETEAPEHWRHGRQGDLTYRFAGSTNTYTWDDAAVSDATATWLALGTRRPARIAAFADAHERLLDVLRQAESPEPDAVHHDLLAQEVTAVWDDQKQVVIIDGLGEAPVGAALGD